MASNTVFVIAASAFWNKKLCLSQRFFFSPAHLKYLISMTFFDHTVLFHSKGRKARFFP